MPTQTRSTHQQSQVASLANTTANSLNTLPDIPRGMSSVSAAALIEMLTHMLKRFVRCFFSSAATQTSSTVICKNATDAREPGQVGSRGDKNSPEFANQAPAASLLPKKCRDGRRRAAQLVSICRVQRGSWSDGDFLCLNFTRRSNQAGDGTKKGQHKPERMKQEPPSFYTPRQRNKLSSVSDNHHEVRDLAMKPPGHAKEICREPVLMAVSAEKCGQSSPTKTSRPSPVQERRETIHLPKVDTYEISPRTVLDGKVERGGKNLLRHSRGKWPHSNKDSFPRNSMFNERRPIAIRKPSAVSGVKLAGQDPEDVLMNTALSEVQKCNVPCEAEDTRPPVKKFVIRLPPVC